MISVITPTHRNWPDLRRAIASLEEQTFTDWQHVVVADGPDPQLRDRMRNLGYRAHGKRVFVELGRNWHGFLGGDGAGQPPGSPGGRGARGSRGVSTGLVGTYLAAGDLIGYLDQDCEYHPKHLELLHQRIKDTGADFAFSQMERWLDGNPWDVVGSGQVAYGQIDGNMLVHHASLLIWANWRWGGDADWDLIGRWQAHGIRAEFVPEVTVRWHHASNDI